MGNICPLCRDILNDPSTDIIKCSCENCGDYSLTRRAFRNYRDRLKPGSIEAAILSHAIKKMQKQQYRPRLTAELVSSILATNEIPTVHEQADNLILLVGDKIRHPGKECSTSPQTDQAAIGAIDKNGFIFILKNLLDKKWLEGSIDLKDHASVTLSFNGWERYYQLKRTISDSRKAFMAMEFGHEELNEVFLKCFKPAVSQSGFNLVRLDEKPKAGLIDDRLRLEIRTSKFLIADLTYENRGAYWEAGFAEGLNKPVIYTCKKDYFEKLKTHFDTNHHLTVTWEENKLIEAAENLKVTVRATLPDEAKLSDE